jgi:hypothetical protein
MNQALSSSEVTSPGIAPRWTREAHDLREFSLSADELRRMTLAELLEAMGLPSWFCDENDQDHRDTTEALDAAALSYRNA